MNDEQLLESFKAWYKEVKPNEFKEFGEMVEVKNGSLVVKETSKLSDTDQMVLASVFTIYAQHHPL